MWKVYGLHFVELKPNVTGIEFEQFVLQQFLPALNALNVPGVMFQLLRADRGERDRKYLFMIAFDSVSTRDRYFPEHNRPSEELIRIIKPIQSLSERWEQLSVRHKTDYLTLS